MTAWYNEVDPYAAQWLRNLIAAGHIAPGVVDERPVQEIEPFELAGFTQCHFFAGIGVWSLALRDAGWPDDQPIWTGSCPCQPFSAAGKQKGFSDDRHLWPYWKNLVEICRPAIVVGEQVASALAWLDLVSTDLEASGYAFAASDLCAAGFGGAHIRQRLYFVGLADSNGGHTGAEWEQSSREHGQQPSDDGFGNGRDAGRFGNYRQHDGQQLGTDGGNVGLADTYLPIPELAAGRGAGSDEAQGPRAHGQPDGRDPAGGLADRGDDGLQGWLHRGADAQREDLDGSARRDCATGTTHAPMLGRNAADWLFCRDGKWRPVEPGSFPLAHAAPARVGRLRAYGNGLDKETASNFLAAVAEIAGIRSLTLEYDL